MTLKRTIRRHDDAFKNEAVKLVLEQGYSVPQAAKALGIATSLLYKWKAQQTQVPALNPDEKAELIRLRKENKQLKMEQDILKKASAYFAQHVK
jgi:transposase